MKQKFIDLKTSMKTKIHRLNLVRDRNTEKYKHLNMLLILIFPVFISCMAEINQAKYVSSFLKFVAERPSVMLFNFIVASLIFYMILAIVKKGWRAMLVHGTIYMLL
ncbi:MAG: LTA synthase family protein, partial [Ruminococcus sp.]